MSRYLLLVILCVALFSCRPNTYVPKPRGYYQLEFPKHAYQVFDKPDYPYSFEYPVYGNIIKDTAFFGKKPENPYWIYIDFPSMNARIYISYKEISADQTFAKLMEDSHRLTYFHTKKADEIQEYNFGNPVNNVSGILYEVSGDAASTYQFIATDSVHSFIRGALYFNVSPNADSLRPANDFMRADLEHLFRTLKWKNK